MTGQKQARTTTRRRCIVRGRVTAAVAVLALLVPFSVGAQDFGVMNSAETINRGNVKLMANPIIVFTEGEAENELGVALVAGYGFTDMFDVEGKVAFFDDVRFFGADAEVWVVKERPVDVSVIGGFHVGRSDGFDTTAFDFTFLGSGHLTPRLELFGGLDFSRNSVDDTDVDFTTAHLVPGIEYAIRPEIDFVAEFGIGLNDDSVNYLSAGFAYYLR
jgi:hypothetical protein